MIVVAVAIAGALGAVARSWVDSVISARNDSTVPIPTLFINTTGSFVLGVITGLALYHGMSADVRTVLGLGFCGGYTTFSTFAYQTVSLAEQRATHGAIANISWSLFAPAIAAAIGLAITAW